MELDEFIRRYQTALKKYVFERMPPQWTEQDIEDMAQEVWERAIRQKEEQYNLSWKWLKDVANSEISHKIRSEGRKLRNAPEININDLTSGLDEWEEEEKEAEPDIFARDDLPLDTYLQIKETLENLPQLDRQVLEDHARGLTERELASEHELTRHQVRNILGRIRNG